MSLAKHSAVRLRVGELLAEGSGLARSAIRECWLPILIVVAAHTIAFVNQHAARSDWTPGPLAWITPLLFLTYVPLYGALYRTALGGPDLKTLGPGGLQWSGVEWRLIAVGVVIVFLSGLAATPFLAATGIAALIPASHTAIALGPLGSVSRWALVVGPIWLIFFWIMAPRLARLMLGWPFSIARGATEPFAGMGPGERSGWAIAIALVLSFIPSLLGQVAVYGLALLSGDPVMGGAWPLPEAIGGGLLTGVLSAAVQAPLGAGVLAGAWWLLEGDFEAAAEHPVEHHGASNEEAALAAAAAHEAETHPVDPDHPDSLGDAEHDLPDDHAAPEAEPVPDAVPEPPPGAGGPKWGVEPLSPWPHSVLPPWPDAQGFEPPPKRAPLAPEPEPAQASPEAWEHD